uniref:Uncharacterized protein n=1 Tax=Arion vulgaris TaxID=1028688 RepID=A0A0B6ZU40_9EUPU
MKERNSEGLLEWQSCAQDKLFDDDDDETNNIINPFSISTSDKAPNELPGLGK